MQPNNKRISDLNNVGDYLYYSLFILPKAISETIHWFFAVEYYTVISRFPVIRMATDPNFSQDQINAKAMRTVKTIKVLRIVFYALVIACFIFGEYSIYNYYK